MATWNDVRRIALSLPGVTEERSKRGTSSWTVGKKFFVWERPLGKSDLKALGTKAPAGDILGARTADLEMKEVLLASDRRAIFTIAHFDGYPAVLILIAKMTPAKLKTIVAEAWLARAPERVAEAFLQRKAGLPKARRPSRR